MEFKFEDFHDATADASPNPSICAVTKQSSDAMAASSSEASKRHAVFSFGKGSNAPSYSLAGSSSYVHEHANLNFLEPGRPLPQQFNASSDHQSMPFEFQK